MKVAVLTSSRADFGIYLPLLKTLRADPFFELDIIAFGTHLSPFHGYTLDQIEEQGFTVKYTIESMLASDSEESIATAMSLTMMKFSAFWEQHQYDFELVFCLGDRYEMFSAVMAGVPFQIRFAHLHGGEKTLGAIDNVFRHSISHAATIHFTSTEDYRRRLLQMVDQPDQVYCTGALSLDNLKDIPLLTTAQFKIMWKIDIALPTVLITFHPESVEARLNKDYAEELVEAIRISEGFQYLITMPNSDTRGSILRSVFQENFSGMNNVFMIENLGTQSYFSAMKHCCFLLGNTSSGIIEAASFGKYVINLGRRQEGRAAGENVINVPIKTEAINKAILDVAQLGEYTGKNIYYCENSVERLITFLKVSANV